MYLMLFVILYVMVNDVNSVQALYVRVLFHIFVLFTCLLAVQVIDTYCNTCNLYLCHRCLEFLVVLTDARREMLLKWKREKEQKKKAEREEKARKQPFQVVHVNADAFSLQKITKPLKVFTCLFKAIFSSLVWMAFEKLVMASDRRLLRLKSRIKKKTEINVLQTFGINLDFQQLCCRL